ncbi:MAG: hypothetical protein SF339_06995 [Blastocatellia bacterium]|nr:hypothetical protein [Blastocatellia bacterium]
MIAKMAAPRKENNGNKIGAERSRIVTGAERAFSPRRRDSRLISSFQIHATGFAINMKKKNGTNGNNGINGAIQSQAPFIPLFPFVPFFSY